MGLWAKIGAVAAMGAVVAVAGIGIFAMLTERQILSEARPVEPRPQTAPVVQSAPSPPRSTPPRWKVRCASVQGQLDCYARQSIYREKTRQRLLTLVVRVSHDTEQPELYIRLPLGIYLPAGALLQIGKVPPKALILERCDLNGCVAKDALSPSELAALLEERRVKILAQNQKKEPLTYYLPVAGFAEVFAKIK